MAQFELWRLSPVERRGRSSDCGLFLFHDEGKSRRKSGNIRKSLAIPSCFKLTSPSSSYRRQQRNPPLSVLPQDTSRYKAFESKSSSTMAPTPIQENLVESNKKYAASFTQGHLALPPAKKYAVCTTPLLPFHPVPTSR
jgi:hypothetical protein